MACVVAALACSSAPAAVAPALSIDVLSNRADLISGGDALVAIGVPSGIDPAYVRVKVGTRNVTDAFAMRPDGRFEGVVTQLANGPNVLRASAPRTRAASITITNHGIGGPVFSGPQIQPWLCQSGAVDKQCNQEPHYRYLYMPAGAAGLQSALAGAGGSTNFFRPYDPDHPPSAGNVATTRTDQGVTVPYVIRLEVGYQDRDQYQIAMLYRPGEPWKPWAPQKQFNRKLLITHGTGCAADHSTVPAPAVTDDNALGRGFAVMSTSLDNAGHNCNVVTQAESLMMAKEHLIETYGELRYTIGTGCSGGSLTIQQVANAYPGIYQGILPQCSFPDAWTTIQQSEDSALVRRYVEFSDRWAPGVFWSSTQIAAVEGHPNPINAIELNIIFQPLLDPSGPCNGVPPEQTFSSYNTKGVRCSLADYMINVLGPRKQDGYAGRPYDNVGVQYGLQALRDGAISPAAFADLNEKVGSHDINNIPQSGRVAADQPALANAYRSGAINEANGLRNVAIIDLRGTDPGLVHDVYRSFATRARLDRSNGTHENQVIWEGPVPIVGDLGFNTQAFAAMDRWLAAVDNDHRDVPRARKIIEDRPASIHDQCTTGLGQEIGIASACKLVNPQFTTPRMVAGQPLATDVIKCQLSPLSRESYLPATFTDAQWGQLRKAFPDGVCDYSRPGVDQQPTVGWLTYAGGAGGQSLGDAPASKPDKSKKKKKKAKKKKRKKASSKKKSTVKKDR